jgi:hypothetical protein
LRRCDPGKLAREIVGQLDDQVRHLQLAFAS